MTLNRAEELPRPVEFFGEKLQEASPEQFHCEIARRTRKGHPEAGLCHFASYRVRKPLLMYLILCGESFLRRIILKKMKIEV